MEPAGLSQCSPVDQALQPMEYPPKIQRGRLPVPFSRYGLKAQTFHRTLLHITTLKGYSERAISLHMQAMNVKSSDNEKLYIVTIKM
jgi:hypothetical protein